MFGNVIIKMMMINWSLKKCEMVLATKSDTWVQSQEPIRWKERNNAASGPLTFTYPVGHRHTDIHTDIHTYRQTDTHTHTNKGII